MEAKKRIRLKVASRCTADWNSMKGDDAVRHCGSCKKDVYQLSNMTTEQVEAMLASAGGPKCGRFYQRKDGTLLTQDCFVGLRRKRRKQAVIGAGIGVLSTLGIAIGAGNPVSPAAVDAPAQVIEAAPIVERVEPAPALQTEPDPDIEEYEMIMGEMAYEEITEPEVPNDNADAEGNEAGSDN